MFMDLDLQTLRRVPKFAHYFRYALHHSDFHEVRAGGTLKGRFAAKPLYGRLTADGKVDRAAGLNGQVAVVFIPARAQSAASAKLFLTRLPRERVTRADGRRNWSAIRTAAERAILRKLASKATQHN